MFRIAIFFEKISYGSEIAGLTLMEANFHSRIVFYWESKLCY